MKGFRILGEPLFSRGLTSRLRVGTRSVAGGVSTYNISGTVFDADGSTPIAGATITLGALTATSAANGTYTISNVPADTSGSMTCTKTGYSFPAITIAAMSGNLTAQNYTNAWWAATGIANLCVAAYQAKNRDSLANSYINLKNPGTFNLTLGSAPSWNSATGWTFDGIGQYLRTGVVPTKQQDTTVTRVTSLTQGNSKQIVGCTNIVASYGIRTLVTPGIQYLSGSSLSISPVTFTAGALAVAGNKGYRNGAAETGTIGDAGTNMGTRDIYIGARNGDGTADIFCAVTMDRLAHYNTTLTQAQIAAVEDAPLPF